MKNYYDTLGVSISASQDDIRAAFWKLAKQYHPDKPSGNAERFKLISEAYNCLSDTEKKAEYDSKFQAEEDTIYEARLKVRTGIVRIRHPKFPNIVFAIKIDDLEMGAIYTLTHRATQKKLQIIFYCDVEPKRKKFKRKKSSWLDRESLFILIIFILIIWSSFVSFFAK